MHEHLYVYGESYFMQEEFVYSFTPCMKSNVEVHYVCQEKYAWIVVLHA